MQGIFCLSSVYQLQCSRTSCKGTVSFDGAPSGILNMGKLVVTHFLLRDYLLHLVHGRYVRVHASLYIKFEK